MKLWSTVPLTRIPHIFSVGLDNPVCEEIIFWTEAGREMMAEQAQDMPDYLAFLQVEFADEDLDEWFGVCLESHGLDADRAEEIYQEMVESEEATDEELQIQAARVQAMNEALDSGQGSYLLAAFDYACIYADLIVPPEALQLLDPTTMLEAVLTKDQAAIIEAAETAEVRGLESMGPNFWVWLIMFMAGLFGPNWGEEVERQEAEQKAEARRGRRKCKVRTKKGARKRRKKPKMAGVA